MMTPIRVLLFFLRALLAFVVLVCPIALWSAALALLIDIILHIYFKVCSYSHGFIILIISCSLKFFSKDFFLVLRNDLDNEVRIRLICKLLETQVDIRID